MKADAIEHRQAAAKAAVIIFRRLMEYYDAVEADAWMNSPHPQLGGETPIELIAAGRGTEVYAVLDRLDADGYI